MPSDEFPDVPIVLFSVDLEWAQAILDGVKRYEYRVQPPSRPAPFYALWYATDPKQAVLGASWIDRAVSGSVDDVVAATVEETPHEVADVREYVDGRRGLEALHVDASWWFDEELPLGAIGFSQPPQNFQYVDAADLPENVSAALRDLASQADADGTLPRESHA